RDANADDLFDFFDFTRPAFSEPPSLAAAANPAAADPSCTTADPHARPEAATPAGSSGGRPSGGGSLPATGDPAWWASVGVGMAALGGALHGVTGWRGRASSGEAERGASRPRQP